MSPLPASGRTRTTPTTRSSPCSATRSTPSSSPPSCAAFSSSSTASGFSPRSHSPNPSPAHPFHSRLPAALAEPAGTCWDQPELAESCSWGFSLPNIASNGYSHTRCTDWSPGRMQSSCSIQHALDITAVIEIVSGMLSLEAISHELTELWTKRMPIIRTLENWKSRLIMSVHNTYSHTQQSSDDLFDSQPPSIQWASSSSRLGLLHQSAAVAVAVAVAGWHLHGRCAEDQIKTADHKKPILYIIPIESILGKLPVVPVRDTGTIPHHLSNLFSGAPGDYRPGSWDGCSMSTRGHWDGPSPVTCNESQQHWSHSATWSATWRGSAITLRISIGMK